jgi:hypothetical protein
MRSVRDLAEQVDDALGKLALAKGQQAQVHAALLLADDDVREAEQAVQRARDALFLEHPELAGGAAPSPVAPSVSDEGFEMVEVDDADDVPIRWTEHD